MHHQMAVDMARDILEYTDYEEIRTMAQNIIDVQEKEICLLYTSGLLNQVYFRRQ